MLVCLSWLKIYNEIKKWCYLKLFSENGVFKNMHCIHKHHGIFAFHRKNLNEIQIYKETLNPKKGK
jgi:hypothetical protein